MGVFEENAYAGLCGQACMSCNVLALAIGQRLPKMCWDAVQRAGGGRRSNIGATRGSSIGLSSFRAVARGIAVLPDLIADCTLRAAQIPRDHPDTTGDAAAGNATANNARRRGVLSQTQ